MLFQPYIKRALLYNFVAKDIQYWALYLEFVILAMNWDNFRYGNQINLSNSFYILTLANTQTCIITWILLGITSRHRNKLAQFSLWLTDGLLMREQVAT